MVRWGRSWDAQPGRPAPGAALWPSRPALPSPETSGGGVCLGGCHAHRPGKPVQQGTGCAWHFRPTSSLPGPVRSTHRSPGHGGDRDIPDLQVPSPLGQARGSHRGRSAPKGGCQALLLQWVGNLVRRQVGDGAGRCQWLGEGEVKCTPVSVPLGDTPLGPDELLLRV